MIEKILEEKIKQYAPADTLEQENILQELMQNYVLASLGKAGFFSEAIFHGGTCLRILYGMNRFSEDLDFLLKKPDPNFRWLGYLDSLKKDVSMEGIHFEMQDRSIAGEAVKKAFLKTDSIGKMLTLELPFARHARKKVSIKLEIDANPPSGSGYETNYLTFPTTIAVTTQTLKSGLATKSHALLCRSYVKGRDWYDLIWYISRNVSPDLDLLANALYQAGPWAGQKFEMTQGWYIDNLRKRISELDWDAVRNDVRRFLPAAEAQSLTFWDGRFFMNQIDRMERYMS